MAQEAKRADQESPEPSTASQTATPQQQAMASAVPAGGPDDASPSSEMAGLEVRDGAPPRAESGDVPAMELCEGAEGLQSRPSNYKTRLCMKWQQHGECSFGNRCNFAHGGEELRPSAATAASSAATAQGGSLSATSSSSSTGAKSDQQNQNQSQAHAQNQLQMQQHQHQSQQHQAQQQQRESGPRGSRAGSERSSGAPWNRKTRLCTKFVNTGSCPYGDRCNFAHGQHELKRPHPNGHAQWDADALAQQMGGMGGMLAMGMMPGLPQMPLMASGQASPKSNNYKTRICLNWHKTGHCQYGARCNFAHGHMELRVGMEKGGFGRGMHGPGHQYPQMNHGNGNAHMAHMQPPIPGVQGMQGMQAFNGMMMNQMPMLGMPGMPDMPPHMMAGAGMTGMMGVGGMPMMLDMEQLKQQMGQMNIDPQMNPMVGQMPGQPPRGRPGPPGNMMSGQMPSGPQGSMMAGMGNGMPMATGDAPLNAAPESPSESPSQAALLPQAVA